MRDFDIFRKAATRLIFDMINADGVIDDEEILFLDSLKAKYHITNENIRAANAITTSDAIAILRDWKTDEKKQFHTDDFFPNGKTKKQKEKEDYADRFTAASIVNDLIMMSGCDGDRSIREGKLLAAISLCLDEECDGIPFKYKEERLHFSKKEIIYIEGDEYDEIEDEIIKNKKVFESMLMPYGYEFVYIPDVKKFLVDKSEKDLLRNILIFSKPTRFSTKEEADASASKIALVETSDFAEEFEKTSKLKAPLPPCLLIKLKSSIISKATGSKGESHTKYSDFVAVPIKETVRETIESITEKILNFSHEITSMTIIRNEDKLYCKGIHKTVIDMAIDKPSEITKLVIDLTTFSGIKFSGDGLPESCCKLQPKALAIYLVLCIMLRNSFRHGIPTADNDHAIALYEVIYGKYISRGHNTKDKGLYNQLSVSMNNIRDKVAGVDSLPDKSIFQPIGIKGVYQLSCNPSIIHVRTLQGEMTLSDWIKSKIELISILKKMTNLEDKARKLGVL